MRWHAHYHTEGTGHLYQGRFKAFPIEEDDHLYAVLRYVERNPVRGDLCELAEDWRFGSLWRRVNGNAQLQSILSDWPLPRPRNWRAHVNKPQSESEVKAIRTSVRRGTPYGGDSWVTQSAVRLQLSHTLRSRGRPRNKGGNEK